MAHTDRRRRGERGVYDPGQMLVIGILGLALVLLVLAAAGRLPG